MNPFVYIILLGLAGSVGAMLRFSLDLSVRTLISRSPRLGEVPGSMTMGIYTVNVLGSFISGMVFASSAGWGWIWAPLVGAALSGFTTFSTAMVDALSLALDRRRGRALALWASQFVLAVAAAFLGYWVV
ncbi:hypothetical protein BSR29_07530 [Boudabousia liubingyangii]|uniref:Fluoride-specific ion channel n=1 Tax=Boudabousia liubingyangii TaxID=1921764 RepID=A0A1Q5PKB6_9ACTO|nr:CrcB family protein [Boudabousia liubingyangii]OKL46658.1 hypothetical protein BSR29_07530 [Boudabousia liubingyangii]OKL46755.1 hypothetical protein BSR28_04740 [Boudabousia liubingyangii]